MPKQKSQGKRSGQKSGRGEKKGAVYRHEKRREKNKLKRIAQSNGRVAALAYAKQHELTGWLSRTLDIH